LPHNLTRTAKCIWYLQQWTFENIVYNRKQSLKTLVDWCNEFPALGNEKFKARLDSYFRFTETTFIYQYIAEHPNEYEQWFQAFYIPAEVPEEPDVYILGLHSEEVRRTEMEKLRDGLSRFLETYARNPGLNFISGLVRLYLDDFQNTDGKDRFENAWDYIISTFPPEVQEEILSRTLKVGKVYSAYQREELYEFLVKFFPEKEEVMAEALDVLHMLYQALEMRVEQLKNINDKINQIYEQIG
jgi:ATP-dependent DNA helicase RecQ